ncbi:Histidine biosynthesis bifunctional protein hisB [Irineochytrium annulatum]|nr:Histidine biosynthesis bifunctional protein hisB [Irineochytrium annulatum]
MLYMLDYGAGNVRSLLNAVKELGHEIKVVNTPDDLLKADRLIFPGVGAFGSAMDKLRSKGYDKPLLKYIESGRPFMGICVGMQCLFAGSDESPGVAGLNLIPAQVKKFNAVTKAVPHMGWNAAALPASSSEAEFLNQQPSSDLTRYYFVHSYAVMAPEGSSLDEWAYSFTRYKDEVFISSVRKGNVFATQFHPEKSGHAGLDVLRRFLNASAPFPSPAGPLVSLRSTVKDHLSRRIIACLDVRTNDAGDLVVTKGDQYDVRESTAGERGGVRNLGKPVELCRRYFQEGADEVTFLNITSFRNCPVSDLPMLEVLKQSSETVFVPLTIGGGIRDIEDPISGRLVPALEVAGEYFRSGADKVSIGSDAVYAAELYYKKGKQKNGGTAIEQIADVYGSQAVVVSVDPRRVYVNSPQDAPSHHVIRTKFPGPKGEEFVWYQCTVKGGREGRDLDVWQLVTACQDLGAGEILCNCMDKDGTNSGFDLELLADVKAAVSIPVIASSGAGKPEHFAEVFSVTGVEAALAAGIFHRREVPISGVKDHLKTQFEIRSI